MDDVDAVQAQIARTMLESGDWVTARLNGIAYLEKAPLKYWMIAVSFAVFGVHDWAARVPVAIAAILLCWVTGRLAAWAAGALAGLYAGLCLVTCVGLFLFTRVLIPDVVLTLAITVALYSFMRAAEPSAGSGWAYLFWVMLGAGLLLKGFIGAVFPIGTAVVFVLLTRRFSLWRHMKPFTGVLLMLAIAAPWHILATLRNPPYFDFTLHSEAGSYRGFFWFYFINEQVLRFLNLRYPRDYNTVPRLYFWLFHLLWLFPWSVYLPSLIRLDYRSASRAARICLLALCWAACVLLFFTFSTSQEYYSMPAYPALALLLGCALASGDRWLRFSTRVITVICALALVLIVAILIRVWGLPAPGDIAAALTQNPDLYTLSLGHMSDLTLQSFAYLRLPLIVAAAALVLGLMRLLRRPSRPVMALAVMMVVFFHAARLALVVFDPYLGTRPLAEALLRAPEGKLIVDDQYYALSSVFFYANRSALLLNGRVNNLEYGSYAPGAPQVFLNDGDFQRLWPSPERYYLIAASPAVPRFERLVGKLELHLVAASGGKFMFSNQPD